MSLTVTVYSFSYKKDIPVSENGGGYVFDCRGMHNPGRYEEYKSLTGLDNEVIDFLEKCGEVQQFLTTVSYLLGPHIENYIERGFDDLTVCFGCTGGQHRSVYCAQHCAEWIREKYPDVHVKLIHRERGIEKEL